MGKHVLFVDFDSQGDSSAYMGFTDEKDECKSISISRIMQEYVSGIDVDIHDIIRVSEKNGSIGYIPSEIGLEGAEMYLISTMSRETA